jgi:hypothetical protein
LTCGVQRPAPDRVVGGPESLAPPSSFAWEVADAGGAISMLYYERRSSTIPLRLQRASLVTGSSSTTLTTWATARCAAGLTQALRLPVN